MKFLIKSAACGLYKYSGLSVVQENLARLQGKQFLSILLFHRVTDAIPPDGLTIGTKFFRDLCGLLRRSFRVISLTDLFTFVKSGEMLPKRTVALTFDDCYLDNLAAARVLSEHGLPGCFFVPSAYVGTDHVFPWDTQLPRMPNLTWDDVREMVRLGHEVGSHTATHADMAQVPLEQARFELTESKATIEARLGRPVKWFAYPYGGVDNFDPARLPLVYEAGYEGIVSACTGFVRPHMAGQILPRIAVPAFPSLLNLELHLTGCLDWWYGMKKRAAL